MFGINCVGAYKIYILLGIKQLQIESVGLIEQINDRISPIDDY